MIEVGVSPIFFDTLKNPFSMDVDYVQKFHSSDRILFQVYSKGGSVTATLNDKVSLTSSTISLSAYQMNEQETIYYATLTGLPDSAYSITINGEESEEFEVCSSDELLKRTKLVRYSNKDNNSFPYNVFWVGDTQLFFELRVECGFDPGGCSFAVDNEQYRNQTQEIIELYSVPYEQYQLVIGDNVGVPVWIAERMHLIFSLSTVEIDGTLYVRSESSGPEGTRVMEEKQQFIYSMTLEKKKNGMAGIGGMPEAASPSSSVAFSIKNPTDGQMLQYDGDESAFVNVTTVVV